MKITDKSLNISQLNKRRFHCRDECVFAGQEVFLRPTSHLLRPERFLVSSFTLKSRNVLFISDTFSKEAVIPKRSPGSETAVTLAARPVHMTHLLTELLVQFLGWQYYQSQSKLPFDLTFKRVNNITHFPVPPFIETSLQCLKIHSLYSHWLWKYYRYYWQWFLVNGTITDFSILLFAFRSVTNNNILSKVIQLAKKPSVWLLLLPSWNH